MGFGKEKNFMKEMEPIVEAPYQYWCQEGKHHWLLHSETPPAMDGASIICPEHQSKEGQEEE